VKKDTKDVSSEDDRRHRKFKEQKDRDRSKRKDRDRDRRRAQRELDEDEEKKRKLKEQLRKLEMQMDGENVDDEEEEDEEMMGVYAAGGSPPQSSNAARSFERKGSKRDRFSDGASDDQVSNESGGEGRGEREQQRVRRKRRGSSERDEERERRRDDRKRRREESRRERRPPPNKRKQSSEICKMFMLGKCPKSPEHCMYSHDADPPKIMELCKFYLFERCAKREKCLYLHKDFPCKYFHTGMRCLDSAESCKFSHGPLNDDTRAVLLKHLENAPKEILGDFPRMNREQAEQVVARIEAKNKGWPEPVFPNPQPVPAPMAPTNPNEGPGQFAQQPPQRGPMPLVNLQTMRPPGFELNAGFAPPPQAAGPGPAPVRGFGPPVDAAVAPGGFPQPRPLLDFGAPSGGGFGRPGGPSPGVPTGGPVGGPPGFAPPGPGPHNANLTPLGPRQAAPPPNNAPGLLGTGGLLPDPQFLGVAKTPLQLNESGEMARTRRRKSRWQDDSPAIAAAAPPALPQPGIAILPQPTAATLQVFRSMQERQQKQEHMKSPAEKSSVQEEEEDIIRLHNDDDEEEAARGSRTPTQVSPSGKESQKNEEEDGFSKESDAFGKLNIIHVQNSLSSSRSFSAGFTSCPEEALRSHQPEAEESLKGIACRSSETSFRLVLF